MSNRLMNSMILMQYFNLIQKESNQNFLHKSNIKKKDKKSEIAPKSIKKKSNQNQNSTDKQIYEQQGHAEELNPNVIKNVMRQFFNFVLSEQNQDVVLEFLKYKNYETATKYTKRIMREFKFNNTYIIRLINKKGYCKLLEYYLTLEVQEWLSNAKIKDITQHLRCIEFLKECCVDKEKLQTIIKYKKKS
ncbi:hypothetical protein TTHERM_00143600 (macronuclear) [Tetrahymena thermophila SB210]|uniref:Uncharacterized protein n=1 Tax=Tetrahymena thermophila (strain SB210) TaxID=312017 RepID=I7MDS3_TETTS|nr:hypothetical protein TTHERM_00143600 [Tetrahymena thermophila SB210]EAR90854.2 hypothetical protein TTHERM_00143600 [Tetrahymena thermophila SB210]|eukprot:XP_001011099.2 hypothetical protein TTHERM_00143600 [Tetrahymena thermophila SB210]